ncbi:MAG: hypothetical protein WC389_15850 [Lutibacter sp.]|jgi:hypothetical protein
MKEGYYWAKRFPLGDYDIVKYYGGYFFEFGNEHGFNKDELFEIGDMVESPWITAKEKQPPFQTEILFKTQNGVIFSGIRFIPTKRSSPVYQDFKKNKIRRNVIRRQLMPE